MSLATQYAASQDATFLTLIQAAIVQTAVILINEAANTVNHIHRVQLATNILLSPTTYVSDFAQAVASQGADKNSTDATILADVSGVWNAIAGIL